MVNVNWLIWELSIPPMNIKVNITAINLTVNESVCSWIWVAAWKIATIRPKIILIKIGGPDRIKISKRAW
jgi:hypothetical protein